MSFWIEPRVRVTTRLQSPTIDKMLRTVEARIGLDAAEPILRAAIADNFEMEKGGDRPWKPLKPQSIARRLRAKVPPGPILYRGLGADGPADPRVLRDALLSDEAVTTTGQTITLTHPVPTDERFIALSRTRSMVSVSKASAKQIREAIRGAYFGKGTGAIQQPRGVPRR